MSDGSGSGEISFSLFRMIWGIACIGEIIYSIRNLFTYSKEQKSKLPATATDVVETPLLLSFPSSFPSLIFQPDWSCK